MRTAALLPIGALLLIAGCASSDAVRDLAAQTGARATAFKVQQDEFVAAQSALNDAGNVRLAVLGELAATEQARTARLADGWRYGGADALLKHLEVAQKVGPAEILSSMDAVAIQQDDLSVGDSGKALTEASARLATMAAKPTTRARLQALYDTAGAVSQAYSDLRKKAAATPQPAP